jgi:hypothetical protein
MRSSRIRENTIDAASALLGEGAGGEATDALRNLAIVAGLGATVIAAGTGGAVSDVAHLTAKVSGKFLVLGTTSGTAAIGANQLIASLQHSVDGGVTWIFDTPVEFGGLPAVGGVAAIEHVSATLVGVATHAAPIGTAVQFRIFVDASASGGSYTTGTASLGTLIVFELP